MKVYHSKDLTGLRVGRLVVVSRAEPTPGNRGARWYCRCDCGGESICRADGLRSGRSKSCGCFSVETAKATHTRHGKCLSREYVAWQNMKKRCSNPSLPCWRNYGGRGISVCSEWSDSFDAFYAHVGDSPGPGYELDRIDNEQGYKPGNVRWVTKAENNLNKRPRRDRRSCQ